MEESLAMIDDLWYHFAGIAIVHPSGCYGVPPTSGISQYPQPFQRIDKTARRPGLPSFIDVKMPSLPPTPPADHQARPVHHRAIQQLSIRQVVFALRIPQLGRAKVPLRGAMVTRERSSTQGSLFIYYVCLLSPLTFSLFHRADYRFSCQALNSKVLSIEQ